MIKVVFFDVDGTLLSHKSNSIPKSTIDALNKLKEDKILRVICSGRHYKELEEIQLEYMDFDAWILLNGQIVLNNKKEIILENPLNNSKIIEMYNHKTMPIQLLEKEDYYINFVDERVEIAQKAIHTPVPEIKEYTGNTIYQAILFTNEDFQFDGLEVTRWNPFGVDVISSGGSKGKAIQQFLDYYHISCEEAMAFGDGDNDIEMLKSVKYGIAMGNSVEALKEIAYAVCDDIDQDGLYKALNDYIWYVM